MEQLVNLLTNASGRNPWRSQRPSRLHRHQTPGLLNCSRLESAIASSACLARITNDGLRTLLGCGEPVTLGLFVSASCESRGTKRLTNSEFDPAPTEGIDER